MNKIILTGRITKDLELRNTTNGKPVCEFTIATNRQVVRDGEKKTDFINCIVWNNQAENLVKYQGKGSLIAIFGELRIDVYEVNDEKKYKTYVLVNNLEFLENKNKSKEVPTEQLTIKTGFDKKGQIEITDEDMPF